MAEGSWVRADRQTGGRGRMGRRWISPPGNLHASTIVRPRTGDPPPAGLALVAAVALDEAAATFADPARLRLKWPNDLLLDAGTGWGKLAGILLEAAGGVVVVGIGVNLAHRPPDLDQPTAALADLGAPPAPAVFVEVLAEAHARWLARWREAGFAAIRARWLARAHPPGTALRVSIGPDEAIDGLFDGLDADGALRLRTGEGVRTIHAGDVALIG